MKPLTWALPLLSLALLASGCENSTGFGFSNRLGKNETSDSIEFVDPGGVTLRLDTWVQSPLGDSRADLIFVVDTSGSLNSERTALTNALSGFLNTLAAQQVDICIGVLLGHSGALSGKLYADSGNAADKCLCVKDLDQNTLISKFRDNVQEGPSESQCDGGECGLFSFHKSFTDPAILAENQAVGCYRNTATLVPTFLTDEDDISAAINCASTNFNFNPVGPAKVVDEDCKEAPARMNFHSDANGNLILGPQQVLAAAQARQGILGVLGVVVGYVGTVPAGGENSFPWNFASKDGYPGFVDLSGGDKVDLKDATDGNQAAFDASFVNLGNTLAKKLNLDVVFDLSKKACSMDTTTVKVDDAEVPNFTLTNSNQRVTISATDAGNAASSVQITYQLCD